MANELVFDWPTGATVYALLFNSSGQMYNGSTFETPEDANWATYDIALTEAGTTGIYRGDMPAVAAGTYGLLFRLRAGGAPAVTDVPVGGGGIEWGGSAALPLSDLATAADLAVVDGNVDLTLVNLSGMDLKLDDILLDTGTDGVVVAAASKTGYALSAAGVDSILDEVVEGAYTFRQMLRLFMAALAGLSDGGGTTTIAFRDVADSKDRIEATVDADGNRTALTLDAT